MGKTYSVAEMAHLAGVPRETLLEWEGAGRLGKVPRDELGKRLFSFEHAVAAIDLGGRTTHRRISVVNQKGGVGKTTTVFTLSAAFAEAGRRVLAVDLDAQANLTSSFGYDPDTLELTSENLITDDKLTAEDVILETAVDGVHLVPADIKLCSVDVKIHDMFMREYILRNKLQHLFGHYHVVLFDCPPNLSKVTINALMASEEVVVPVETQSYSIKAISDLTNTFALIRSKMNHTLKVWILPTKVDRRVRLANDFLQALDRHFGAALLDPISIDANIVKAPMIYEPVTRSFPATRAAREYLRLARFLSLPDAERDAYRPVPDRFVGIEDEFDDPFSPPPETDPSLYDERPAAPVAEEPAPTKRSTSAKSP
jgi:chromosome partitioning protein